MSNVKVRNHLCFELDAISESCYSVMFNIHRIASLFFNNMLCSGTDENNLL